MSDVINGVTDLITVAGTPGAIAILELLLIIAIFYMFSKRLANVTDAINNLSEATMKIWEKVERPHLDTEQSIVIFKSVMRNHVQSKMEYLGETLERNSIQDRRPQIEKNIEREFRKITSEETAKLSSINSVCGDMGIVVKENIDWDKFLSGVYDIFFNNDSIRQKLSDIKILMNDIVDYLTTLVEENGLHNC